MGIEVKSGIFGLAVADALGVPVEFMSRAQLRENPVTDMRGYGTHHQPRGTWSDDTSMTLCLAESLAAGEIDYEDIMNRFCRWWVGGEYTPHGYAFDIGRTTGHALSRFREGAPPLHCGGKTERDNGNGALMRILPAAFVVRGMPPDECTRIVHDLTALTHAHPRALIASGIYVRICMALLDGLSGPDAVARALEECRCCYREGLCSGELKHYERLMRGVRALREDDIRSGGYVVDTIEAAIWCLLTTDSYGECVLRAVNLGEDTDTVGAVAGGMAGLLYGFSGIPKEWVRSLVRAERIDAACDALQRRIG